MLEFLVIIFCIFLNGLLAAFEMAFVTISRPELRKLSKEGKKEATRLLHSREKPERMLSVIQIGINLVGALSAAVGGAGAHAKLVPLLQVYLPWQVAVLETMAVLIVVVPLTYFTVVLGELVPKALALRSPTAVALKGSPWMRLADKILSPFVTVLEFSTKRILKLLGKKKVKNYRPEELSAVELEELSSPHRQYVLNLFHIEHKKIKDIYLPWEHVVCINIHDDVEKVTSIVFTSGHTRLPVVDENWVLGVLHTKEFLAYTASGEKNWNSLLRPVLKITEGDSLLKTLRLIQQRRSHLAVVYSQQGSRLGIVTLEDIMEEIVGDIYDEDDDSSIPALFASRAKSSWGES